MRIFPGRNTSRAFPARSDEGGRIPQSEFRIRRPKKNANYRVTALAMMES